LWNFVVKSQNNSGQLFARKAINSWYRLAIG